MINKICNIIERAITIFTIVFILLCLNGCESDRLEMSSTSINDAMSSELEEIFTIKQENNIESDMDNENRKDINMDNFLILDTTKPKVFKQTQIFDSIDDYPRVDGSTALIPLMAKVMQNSCNISEEISKENTTCSKTANAWKNLASDRADLLIVGEIPENIKYDLGNYYKKEILYSPIRREGLVFIVNKDNPVNSLTKEQLIDIYTGKVTNWQELGGEDVEIRAFQRNENSGSQTNFRKILMKDIEPVKMETEKYILDMGGLIDEIARYDNTKNAIGYSVYYYANMMYTRDDLKIIAVDGVEPSNQTIADNTYPLITESYVAVRKDNKKAGAAYKLYDYIRSNMGRQAIIDAGYVPVQ